MISFSAQVSIVVTISVGELLDKISILEIKKEKIKDANKLKFINDEYNILKDQLNNNVKTDDNFNQFIKKKYGSIAAAQATTMHCEHKTKDLTVSADSLTVSNGVSSSDYDAIDAYTYWDRVNENLSLIHI